MINCTVTKAWVSRLIIILRYFASWVERLRKAVIQCWAVLKSGQELKPKPHEYMLWGYNMINNRNIGNQKMRANRGSLINSWEGLFRAGLKGRPFLTLWSELLRAAHDRARILIALRTEIENWTRWNALAQKGRKDRTEHIFFVRARPYL